MLDLTGPSSLAASFWVCVETLVNLHLVGTPWTAGNISSNKDVSDAPTIAQQGLLVLTSRNWTGDVWGPALRAMGWIFAASLPGRAEKGTLACDKHGQ